MTSATTAADSDTAVPWVTVDLADPPASEDDLRVAPPRYAIRVTGSGSIPDNFLEAHTNLTAVDLSPLTQVASVGACFLYGCRSLTAVDLRPLGPVTRVANFFLDSCAGLAAVDLSPLNHVTSVGDCFLSGCSGLTAVDLSPLSRVTAVGDFFLADCTSLTAVDFSPLGQVSSVGDDFLKGCTGLAAVGTSPRVSTRVLVAAVRGIAAGADDARKDIFATTAVRNCLVTYFPRCNRAKIIVRVLDAVCRITSGMGNVAARRNVFSTPATREALAEMSLGPTQPKHCLRLSR